MSCCACVYVWVMLSYNQVILQTAKDCFSIPTASAAAVHAAIQDGYWPMLQLLLGFRSSSSIFQSLQIVCAWKCVIMEAHNITTHRARYCIHTSNVLVSVQADAQFRSAFCVLCFSTMLMISFVFQADIVTHSIRKVQYREKQTS